MDVIALLEQHRPTWLSKVSQGLATAEPVREKFLEPLDRFYTLVIQAVGSGQISVLFPLLDEWLETRLESEPGDVQSYLPSILNRILMLTYDMLNEQLSQEQALYILGTLLPLHISAVEYTISQESEMRVQRVYNELGRAKGMVEQLEKSKSDFIAVAAHELKTPLTLIDGYASMLKEILPAELEDHGNPVPANMFMQGISSGTRRLREIVDDMIDVSVIDNNMLSLNFQPLWIYHLMEIIRREFDEIMEKRHLVLNIHNFPGNNEMTFGDGERLLQAFRNLVSNAIKYTPDGGTITINGRLLPGFVEITFQDTGIGIDPDDQTRIFEKFGRLGDTATHSTGKTKFKGGGPGLGLPITKGIIEGHGGAIWVESEAHDEKRCPGATFHVLLPIHKTPPDALVTKLFHPITGTVD